MKQKVLEKLTIAQIVKKFPALCWNQIHYRLHNNPLLDPYPELDESSP